MDVNQTVLTVSIPAPVDLAAFQAAISLIAPGANVKCVKAFMQDEEDVLAASLADAIVALPTGQWQLLRILLAGGDSFSMSDGDARFSIANDLSGASRRLMKVCANPLDRLFVKRRTYFKEGGYKGISYSASPFGQKVLAKLKEIGS